MDQGWENTMMGIPLGCNGFIPDYIDTTNLTPGDKVYIIDPKHDDTSKYVLSENKTWSYAGNYNNPEVGGVEGNDYSNIASEQGGMWLIRQNPEDASRNSVAFEMRRKNSNDQYFGKWKVIRDYCPNKGDVAFGSTNSTVWVDSGGYPDEYLSSIPNYKDLAAEHDNDTNGAWVWTSEDQLAGNEPRWIETRSALDEIGPFE